MSEPALGTLRSGRDTDENAAFAQLDLFRDRAATLPGTRVADWVEPWQPDSWEHRGNERTWAVGDAMERTQGREAYEAT